MELTRDCCIVLHCVAVCCSCSVFQCAALGCTRVNGVDSSGDEKRNRNENSMLQCIAVCCSGSLSQSTDGGNRT